MQHGDYDAFMERVHIGANTIRSHYSLSDMVRDDHLIFVNGLLSALGPELGICFSVTSRGKEVGSWTSVTSVDLSTSANGLDLVKKHAPHITYSVGKSSCHLTLFACFWGKTKRQFKFTPLDPKSDFRVQLAKRIINHLDKDKGLGTNALERGFTALEMISRTPPTTSSHPANLRAKIDPVLESRIDGIFKKTINTIYSEYFTSYLLQHPDPTLNNQLSRAPLVFARQYPSDNMRFGTERGFRYGIKLVLPPSQSKFLKQSDMETDLYETEFQDERSVLDTTFSLGVINRSDISIDDDTFQLLKGKRLPVSAKDKRRLRSERSSTILSLMVGSEAKGVQLTTFPLLTFGCPFGIIGLVHPKPEGRLENENSEALWRHRHLFYDEFMAARASRKFRSIFIAELLDFINLETRKISRIHRPNTPQFLQRLNELLFQISLLTPAPLLRVTPIDKNQSAPEPNAERSAAISYLGKPQWQVELADGGISHSTFFSRPLSTDNINVSFRDKVARSIERGIRRTTLTWYNRFTYPDATGHDETTAYYLGEMATKMFAPSEKKRLVVVEGRENIRLLSIVDAAVILAIGLRSNSIEDPLLASLFHSHDFWRLMVRLVTPDELNQVTNIEHIGLHRAATEEGITAGDWAKANPNGAVVACLHSLSVIDHESQKRLQMLLNVFNTTVEGVLVITVQDAASIRDFTHGAEIVYMSEVHQHIAEAIERHHAEDAPQF